MGLLNCLVLHKKYTHPPQHTTLSDFRIALIAEIRVATGVGDGLDAQGQHFSAVVSDRSEDVVASVTKTETLIKKRDISVKHVLTNRLSVRNA